MNQPSSKPEKRTKSGEHEAVTTYREKLESIVENTASSVDDLNDKLAKYLEDVRTPVPPPMTKH